MAKLQISRRSLLGFICMAMDGMDDESFSRFATINCCALGLCDADGNVPDGFPEMPYPNFSDDVINSIENDYVRDVLRDLNFIADGR